MSFLFVTLPKIKSMVKVKNVELVYDNLGLESIKCDLGCNRIFSIEITEFYFTLIDNDENLFNYSQKFENWDELTNDLMTLGFPFKQSCEDYINTQFTPEEIVEFTYKDEEL